MKPIFNKTIFNNMTVGKILHGCEDVSLLIVKSSDKPLTLSEKALIQSHILFCRCCKNFIKESSAMDKSLRTYFDNIAADPPQKLSDTFKQTLEDQLKQ